MNLLEKIAQSNYEGTRDELIRAHAERENALQAKEEAREQYKQYPSGNIAKALMVMGGTGAGIATGGLLTKAKKPDVRLLSMLSGAALGTFAGAAGAAKYNDHLNNMHPGRAGAAENREKTEYEALMRERYREAIIEDAARLMSENPSLWRETIEGYNGIPQGDVESRMLEKHEQAREQSELEAERRRLENENLGAQARKARMDTFVSLGDYIDRHY